MIEFKKTFGADHSADFKRFKELLSEAGQKKQKVTFYIHFRHMRDRFSCIDIPQEPVTLTSWWMQGGLLYYKKNRFECETISFDDVDLVTVDDAEEAAA